LATIPAEGRLGTNEPCIREDIRAVGLALAGDLITPEQALDHLDDIMQPELS
jgi:hypothetical protein